MADAELPEDVREVSFDRAVGQEERRGDLPVRLALGDEGATRSSAGVSAPGVAARPLIRFSSARARSAHSAAPIASKISSARLERFARLAPSLRAPLRRAERQQGPPVIEGKSYLRMQLESLVEGSERTVEIAVLAGEEPTTARAVGESRDASEHAGVPLVPPQKLDRLVQSSGLEQRLDEVGDESRRSRLDDSFLADEVDVGRKLLDGLLRTAER